jgi:hypothetical protein
MLVLLALSILWSDARPMPGGKGPVVLPSGEILIAGGATEGGKRLLVCHSSSDEGKSWRRVGTITEDSEPTADVGDGNIVRLKDGRLLIVFRRNHTRRPKPDYAIEVAESRDEGRTWRKHSVVQTSQSGGHRPSRGLWAPFLLVTSDGGLQCYYDDENIPWLRGFPGHQWVMMERFVGGRWVRPTVVSRANNPRHLSRDGMAVVVETAPGRLFCALESVQVRPPHAGMLRWVTSDDGGRTWSWAQRERGVLYEPKDTRYHAFAPWLVSSSGRLLCVFATNEDRDRPGISGTPAHQLNLDIKSIASIDNGATWDRNARLVYGGTHRNYLPSVVGLPSGKLLSTFIDFDRGGLTAVGSPE